MNKETVYQKLIEYAANSDDSFYYVNLAQKMACLYPKYLTEHKLFNVYHAVSDTLMFTRLPFSCLDKLQKEEMMSIYFSTTKKFSIGDHISFVINLKDQVIKFEKDGVNILLKKIYYLDEFLTNMNISLEHPVIQEYYEKRIFLSYFYQYVYILLEEQAKSNQDLACAGCFLNAYFDLIYYSTTNHKKR